MATIMNDRDVLLQATQPRFTEATGRGMFINPDSATFKVSSSGAVSPASMTFQVVQLNMAGDVTFTASNGVTITTNANECTLAASDFVAGDGTITATTTVDGTNYTSICYLTKVTDGVVGGDGSRGNVQISVLTAGSVWSDSEAATAITAAGYGAPRNRDLVTMYKADKSFSATRVFDGHNWIAVTYIYNGNMFVNGSILPESIDTRGLTIKDAAGNVILDSGTTLAQQVRSNPNLAPTPNGFNLQGSLYAARNGDPRFGDGQYLWLNPTSDASFCGALSPALGIPAGAQYTVSFDAYCTDPSTPRTLVCDVYGQNSDGSYYDSAGIGVVVTGTMTKYKYTEIMSANGNGTPYLRIFTAQTGGSVIVVSNIKVELGANVTPWEDSVITAANLTTYIKGAIIGVAQINTATIGNLSVLSKIVTARAGGTGAGIDQDQNGIRIFDGNNVRRVTIGNLDV